MKKKLLLCTLMSICIFSLTACGDNVSLFDAVFGTGSNEIIGTMTIADFDLKVDRLLTTVFTDAETHLANSKYVIEGTRGVDEEYSLVQTSIANAQDVIDEIDKLSEPVSKSEDKANVLLALTDYKNGLLSYAIALQSNDMVKVGEAADVIMATEETLKGNWQTYTE